jgi:uncharacterized membrane protein
MEQKMKWRLVLGLLLVPSSVYAIEKMDCVGTEPFWSATLTDGQVSLKLFDQTRRYSKPMYGAAAGASADYVMSVQARSGTSNLAAFVVNETEMIVADNDGRAHKDRNAYRAYCSDGMSDLGFPYSIHLIVDGKTYTGCCSTVANPPVGQK